METGGLNTTTNSGTQNTTQSPQSVGGNNLSAGLNSNLQTTPASNSLNSNVGVNLTPAALTTVNLNNLGSNQAVTPSTTNSGRHINAGLLIMAILLFAFAIYLFFKMSKTNENNTTD